MTTIRVLHCNSAADGWTADSPDLQGWNVVAATYGESRTRAEEAIRARLADAGDEAGEGPAAEDVQITHHIACSRG